MAPPSCPPGRSPGDLFDDFLDLHDQCAAAGLTDAAYYALAGALRCAGASSSTKCVSLVIDLARLRQRRLDREVPRHPLSTFSAQQRGQTPLFESLAVAGVALKAQLEQGGTDQHTESEGSEAHRRG